MSRPSWFAIPLVAALVGAARAEPDPLADHRGVLVSAGVLAGSGAHGTVDAALGLGVARSVTILARGSLTRAIDDYSEGSELGVGVRIWGGRMYFEPQVGRLRYGYPVDCIRGPSTGCTGGKGTGVAAGLELGVEVVRLRHFTIELRAGATSLHWPDPEGPAARTLLRAGFGMTFRL